MSRESNWEDEDLPGQGGDDEEPAADFTHSLSTNRSAVVSGAGIITLTLGTLVVLGSLCGSIVMLIGAFTAMDNNPMMREAKGGMLIALIICLLLLLWGVGAITSGIGILNRRNWGRILTLVLSGFGALAGLLFLFIAIAACFAPANGNHRPTDMVIGFLIFLFLGLFFLGYCLWIYLILLSSRYGAEFR